MRVLLSFLRISLAPTIDDLLLLLIVVLRLLGIVDHILWSYTSDGKLVVLVVDFGNFVATLSPASPFLAKISEGNILNKDGASNVAAEPLPATKGFRRCENNGDDGTEFQGLNIFLLR